MLRNLYRPLMLVALFAMAACSAGTTNSSVPGSQSVSQQSANQATAQTQTRTALGDKQPPPPPPKKIKPPPPCPTKTGKKGPKGDFDYCLFGDATLIQPGHNSPTAVEASTDGSATYGGVDFGAPVATFHDLTNLSTDVRLVSGANSCAFGSPRFDVGVTNGTASGDIFVTIPCDTVPVGTWSNSGNVFNCTDPNNGPGACIFPSGGICASGVPMCYQGMSYAQAEGFYGSYTVTDIAIVVDPSNGPEDVQFDNVMINSVVTTFEPGADNDGDGPK